MNKVAVMDRMTAFGLKREQFREVYFYLNPFSCEEEFDYQWQDYCKDKAEQHIRKLNEKATT